jgi:hypothetical protein
MPKRLIRLYDLQSPYETIALVATAPVAKLRVLFSFPGQKQGQETGSLPASFYFLPDPTSGVDSRRRMVYSSMVGLSHMAVVTAYKAKRRVRLPEDR